MKRSWGQFFRRVAVVCMVAIVGSGAWQSAVCYAAAASDSATDPAYASGWTQGSNGGTGFGPWDFTAAGSNSTGSIHDINSSDSANNLGTAWRLANTTFAPFAGGDVSTAGRGAPLAVGETLSMIVDTPSTSYFYRGFIIRLTSGGANQENGGTERLALFHFNFGGASATSLQKSDAGGSTDTGLDLTDTDGGARLDFSLTGPESYAMKITSLDSPVTYLTTGSLSHTGSGPVNWVEFVQFNTNHDPAAAHDLYISSMQIHSGVVPEPTAGLLAAAGAGALAVARLRKRRSEL